MKKTLALIIAILMLAVFVVGCADQTTTTSPSAGADQTDKPSDDNEGNDGKKLTFGLVVKNLSNPYFVTLADGAKEAAAELGIEIDVQATTDDTQINEQINLLDTMVTQNYDAIIFSPLNNTSAVPWVKRANDASVPVINVDTALNDDELKAQGASVVCKIFTDNISAGEEAAKAIVEALGGKGKIAMLEGTSGATTAEDRKTGFYNIIDKEEGIEVVASVDAKYNRNEAYTAMTTILAANPDIQAVFAANDEMALGAIAAIEEAGKTGDIKVIGVNYGEEIQQAMKDGKAYGSVNQDPHWIGYQAVMCAKDYLDGKELEDVYTSESVMMLK